MKVFVSSLISGMEPLRGYSSGTAALILPSLAVLGSPSCVRFLKGPLSIGDRFAQGRLNVQFLTFGVVAPFGSPRLTLILDM
jgi:hypothetical protein